MASLKQEQAATRSHGASHGELSERHHHLQLLKVLLGPSEVKLVPETQSGSGNPDFRCFGPNESLNVEFKAESVWIDGQLPKDIQEQWFRYEMSIGPTVLMTLRAVRFHSVEPAFPLSSPAALEVIANRFRRLLALHVTGSWGGQDMADEIRALSVGVGEDVVIRTLLGEGSDVTADLGIRLRSLRGQMTCKRSDSNWFTPLERAFGWAGERPFRWPKDERALVLTDPTPYSIASIVQEVAKARTRTVRIVGSDDVRRLVELIALVKGHGDSGLRARLEVVSSIADLDPNYWALDGLRTPAKKVPLGPPGRPRTPRPMPTVGGIQMHVVGWGASRTLEMLERRAEAIAQWDTRRMEILGLDPENVPGNGKSEKHRERFYVGERFLFEPWKMDFRWTCKGQVGAYKNQRSESFLPGFLGGDTSARVVLLIEGDKSGRMPSPPFVPSVDVIPGSTIGCRDGSRYVVVGKLDSEFMADVAFPGAEAIARWLGGRALSSGGHLAHWHDSAVAAVVGVSWLHPETVRSGSWPPDLDANFDVYVRCGREIGDALNLRQPLLFQMVEPAYLRSGSLRPELPESEWVLGPLEGAAPGEYDGVVDRCVPDASGLRINDWQKFPVVRGREREFQLACGHAPWGRAALRKIVLDRSILRRVVDSATPEERREHLRTHRLAPEEVELIRVAATGFGLAEVAARRAQSALVTRW